MSDTQYSSFYEEVQQKFEVKVKGFTQISLLGTEFHIEIASRSQRQPCPYCGHDKCYRHEHNHRRIFGGTINGSPLIYDFDDIRYRCPRCETTFFEEHECLPYRQRLTLEAEEYILRSIGSQTFSGIAENVGLSVQSIVNRAVKYADSEKETMLNGHYKFLSMDEVYLGRDKNNAHIICWVLNDNSRPWKSNNIMIGIGNSKDDVVRRLRELTFLEEVEAISIDMSHGYLSAIRAAIPKAAIVVDRFHLIKLASELVNQLRKRAVINEALKKVFKEDAALFLTPLYSLNGWDLEKLDHHLGFNKELDKMYMLFQELLEFYNIWDYEQALDYLGQWESEAIASQIPEALSLLKTITNWLPYIMNFFKYRITNGRTEGKNNLLRQIDRMGFHYGVHCLQACIYAHDRKQERVKWEKYQRKLELKQQPESKNNSRRAA